jgi:hypothetical protein
VLVVCITFRENRNSSQAIEETQMEPSSIFIPSTRDSMELLYDWRLPFIKGEESLRSLRLTYGFVLSSPGSPIAGVALAFLCQIVLRATLDHIQPLFSLLALTVYCKTSSASQNFPLFLGISRCLMFANEKFFLLWSECLCFPKFLWWIPMPTSPPPTHTDQCHGIGKIGPLESG